MIRTSRRYCGRCRGHDAQFNGYYCNCAELAQGEHCVTEKQLDREMAEIAGVARENGG